MEDQRVQNRSEVERLLHGPDVVLRPLTELKRLMPPHRHEPPVEIRDIYEEHRESLTVGQHIADGVAAQMGSWRFIIAQSCLLVVWLVLNIVAFIHHWDPYPFILLNLALSFQAAYAAPIIMMSQNRQAAKDRLEAHSDYVVSQRAEKEVAAILQHLEYQDALILQILTRMEPPSQAQSPVPEAPAS